MAPLPLAHPAALRMSVLSGVLQPDRHAPVAPADKARGPAERAQVRDAHELQDANVNKRARGTSSTDYYREQGTNDDHHTTIRSAAARPLQEPHSLQTLLLLLSINREEEKLQSTVPFDVYPPDNKTTTANRIFKNVKHEAQLRARCHKEIIVFQVKFLIKALSY
uniref:(northern house mosquito) hypothetical protein n=1 Tax=Culex pipiens TaxID=7175 RepID=A0A8D8KP19_CULPI